jgi:hypothetical protein
MNASAPLWLRKGLPLEDTNVLLPWGTSTSELSSLGVPTKSGSGGEQMLCWVNARVFRGLTATVTAQMNPRRGLRELELHVGANGKSPPEIMANVSSHLRSLFGPPTQVHEREQDGTGTEAWVMPPIIISHGVFERFGLYYRMRVQHRGLIDHDLSAA